MSFIGNSVLKPVRQPGLISSLANSFRALYIAPTRAQRKTVAVRQQIIAQKDLKPIQRIIPDEAIKCQEIFNNVNHQISTEHEGRLFAVVHLCGKQFKVTSGDIILVEGYWPPTINDEIRLEKVLLAGAKDFTLIGRPLLEPGLVNIKATIIEKTLAHTRTHFKKKRRKQYTRINFQRSPNTMIRINTIEIGRKVDASLEVPNENRIF